MNQKNVINREIFIISLFIIIFIIMIAFILPKEIYVSTLTPYRRIVMNRDFEVDKINACYGNKFFDELSYCLDISDQVKITGEVNTHKEGQYVLIYSVVYRGIEKVFNQTVDVIFDLEPQIDLKGEYDVIKCTNGEYNHPEFSVIDDKDGDLTSKVEYYANDNVMTYSVIDSSGNVSTANRNILADNVLPTIKLNGDETISHKLGKEYIDPGYLANDNCDGDLSGKITVNSDVDINIPGVYLVEFVAKDSSNNQSNVIRKVIIGEPSIPNKGKDVYLTFDDGPNVYTPALLKVLKKYNVKATFFVTGQFPKYHYLISDIKNEGHVVALHTYSHRFKEIYASPENFFADIDKLNEVISQYTGEKTNLLRFAGGSSNQMASKERILNIINLTKERGYRYFDWNVDSQDTKYKTADEVAGSTIYQLKSNKPYYIVLQHDSKSMTAAAVDKIIRFGLKNGYEFKVLSQDSPTIQHR